jgi:lipid II:glycine glycyltransferase (peptidoglycan interpeptide bridge formation enzyme)
MKEAAAIQYLTRSQIDTVKWDQCINKAENGRIYASSVYLDTMSANWDALVLNDYEAVMPLTWNSKYGIQYLYQPFLAAQLGVFGSEEVQAFIEAIPAHFRFIDIYLNSANTKAVKGDTALLRDNYILDLNHTYEKLFTAYRENIRRNIKKAKQAGCLVQKDFDVDTVINLASTQMHMHDKKVKENIGRFRTLYKKLKEKKQAATYGISLHGEMIASCVFFFSHQRAYYILVGNHPNGKTIGASHALIDAFIADHAGQDLLLDFEGSDIRNLAFFYSSFGATQEIYPALKINRLPFYLRWLKK